MKTISAYQASLQLEALVEKTVQSNEPILITGKQKNAVLVSQSEWRSLQETLFLLTLPGMRESILDGLETPTDEYFDSLDW